MSRGICVFKAISGGDASEPILSCPHVLNGHMTVRIQHTLTDCGIARGAVAAVRGLSNQHCAVFIDAVVVTVAVSVAVGESSEKIRILREIADAGGADGLVNRSGKVFGVAVSAIATTRLPENVKFAVADEVFEPMANAKDCAPQESHHQGHVPCGHREAARLQRRHQV